MSEAAPSDFIRHLGLLALGSRFRRISDRLMAEVKAVYRSRGLTFEPKLFPIFRLLAAHGPLSVTEVAAHLGMSHVRVSQLTKQMEKLGFSVSAPDPADERRRLLRLPWPEAEVDPALRRAWRDLEAAVRGLLAEVDLDVLRVLDDVEAALDRRSLGDRVADLERTRTLEDVRVVPWDRRHAAAFRDLNLAWIERYFEVEPIDRALLDDPERHYLERGGQVLFALLGDEVVGTVALLPDDDGSFELSKMAVDPAHQGKGIGRKLIDAAVAEARARGKARIHLVTNSTLETAVALYKRSGFVVTASGPHPKYARCNLQMALEIA